MNFARLYFLFNFNVYIFTIDLFIYFFACQVITEFKSSKLH